jgi:methionyl aminopeptidase
MIEILNHSELARARETGALVGHILHTLKSRATVGTNLLDIDRWAKAMIIEAGAQSCYVDYAPSFGRGPFGHYICTSVNDAVLHGLPHNYTWPESRRTPPSVSSSANRSPRRALR